MNLLFVCIANSARSQMAEGLAKELLPSSIVIHSAGSAPCGVVNKYAIQVMNEVGIDISLNSSKHWDSLPRSFLENVNVVITLCEEECPNVGTNSKKISWALKDPANTQGAQSEILKSFRKTRDDIKMKILNFGEQNRLI